MKFRWLPIALFMLLGFNHELYAECSCNSVEKSVEEAVRGSNLIVSGRVVNIVHANNVDYVVKLHIYNTWLATDDIVEENGQQYVHLISTLNKEECGSQMKLGHNYLIYSNYVNGQLVVSKCSNSKKLEKVPSSEFIALDDIVGQDEEEE